MTQEEELEDVYSKLSQKSAQYNTLLSRVRETLAISDNPYHNDAGNLSQVKADLIKILNDFES